MTTQQLDEVLRVWKLRLSAIAENLLELQSDATYQSLTGSGGLDKVNAKGATAAAIEPALRMMHVLFQQFGLLQSTVDQAEKLRTQLPSLFGTEAKLREIEVLLFARSIEVQAHEVPLAERHLLSGARSTQRLAPEELLELMTRTFGEVRDAVAHVGSAWSEFAAASEACEGEIGRLRAQTALPTRLLAPLLDDVDAKLASVREGMVADPIGSLARLHAIVEPAIAGISQRTAKAEQTRLELRAARSRWDALQEINSNLRSRSEEVKARFSDEAVEADLLSPAKLQSLGEWLGRLDGKCEEGALEAIAVGLRNWNASAEACIAQARKALAACDTRLASRGELRGRMDALKAKARAYGLAEAAEFTALCSGAEELLYARPMDLHRAAEAVAQYEHRLRAVQPVRGAETGLRSR